MKYLEVFIFQGFITVPTLKLEVADNPTDLAHGLMFRKNLDKDSGMLFKFQAETQPGFWGKNTYIPLDVAFVNSKNEIVDIKQITPLSTRIVNSSGFCTMAIEANAGFFQTNNINKGHKIEFVPQEDKTCLVRF